MILLDTREFDHPVPLEMAVDAFKKLTGDEVIHMIHRREPIPLFEIIVKNGGRYLSVMETETLWHIYITRSSTLELEHTHV
ncbi:MAG: hypothetical protein A2023_05765 [Sulfuricurvum sp. GWF2_44_89]|uniref:DUF2249 domain-containing protein n=1 Tax=Sulfuricurvum kujiense TaxID=148813 RepID=A0A2D3WPD8_9BACT|nr:MULTISPECIES: DUF2249 domain-containing protein [Sulfuricurvum]OHD77420.1 MAG: hypothetical protein A2023_05765 [Sulfuricurvum sp. GWF2_44_89]OHD91221.1 MAG: hypothetical protein A2552_04415 [Sulfuricurvum sp. RIFOXYD2_FULL_44_160]OHD93229.1 MAG: hypothetical protein A2517_06305 [Sulfuricurvum sp. RIFOXYD12_FULL_44_77]DAB38553.1 MAG TPA: hypothetical protein CFH83_05395 [Sulfuricurvum kujiense]